MEQTNTLNVDFTQSASSEEFVSACAGDYNSRVVNLNVTPALTDGELLLCTVSKHNGDGAPTVVQSMVVTDNKLVLPSSMLQGEGKYILVFAVAGVTGRLTSSTVLNVAVAPDMITIVPDDSGETDRSAVSGILAYLQDALDAFGLTVSSRLDTQDAAINGLQTSVSANTSAIGGLQTSVSANSSAIGGLQTSATANASAIAQIAANLHNGAAKITWGSSTLYSETSETACAYSTCRWLRVNDFVLVGFGFVTQGYSSFSVDGLPFSCSAPCFCAPLVSCDYSYVGVTSDFDINLAQINLGSTAMQIRRQSTAAKLLSGFMMYTTSDPWPQAS